MKIATVNPATGRKLREYDAAEETQVTEAVAQARKAFTVWRECAPSERGKILAENLKSVERTIQTIETVLDGLQL